jgi:hypothetical protein
MQGGTVGYLVLCLCLSTNDQEFEVPSQPSAGGHRTSAVGIERTTAMSTWKELNPLTTMLRDGRWRLEETDDEAILEGIRILFPLPTVNFSNEEERTQWFLKSGSTSLSHFVLLNWYNLLSRGSNWNALEHLSDYANEFFKTDIAHKSGMLSFIRKQARIISSLSKHETLDNYNFSGTGSSQSNTPKEAFWSGCLPEKFTSEEWSKLKRIVDVSPDEPHEGKTCEKRKREADE